MKTKCKTYMVVTALAVLLAAAVGGTTSLLTACTPDEASTTAPDALPVPQLTTRGMVTGDEAVLLGFDASGNRTFTTGLTYDGTGWAWTTTAPDGTGCTLLTAIVGSDHTGLITPLRVPDSYTPGNNSRLRMGTSPKISGSPMVINLDDKLARIRVQDNLKGVKSLTLHLYDHATPRYADATLTLQTAGEKQQRSILLQEADGSADVHTGLYSVLPQTFNKGEALFTYVGDNGSGTEYEYTYYMESTITLDSNDLMTVYIETHDDWQESDEPFVSLSLGTISVTGWSDNGSVNGGELPVD